VRNINWPPLVRNCDFDAGEASVANASIVSAVAESAGPVAISRPGRPTQRSRKSSLVPSCLLNASIECARNVAGTGALGPNCDRTAE
jgi:hypothetical protein